MWRKCLIFVAKGIPCVPLSSPFKQQDMSLHDFLRLLRTESPADITHRPRWQRLGIDALQRIYLTVKFFIERGHIDYATQLSFNTIMAIVPLFALIFAVGKGFGLMESLEVWCRQTFSAQPQAAEMIINLAQSYLKNTSAGIFIGIGLVFMLYSLLSLIRNVEGAFNGIWQVTTHRSWATSIASYSALLFLAPITLIVLSGLSVFMYGVAEPLWAYFLLGSVARFLLSVVLPWLLLTFIFAALYVLMPNTKVQLRQALVPSFLASALMLMLQNAYVHVQSILTGYSAVYGSLAALPLFMLWMQLSWYICLFCAELCYTNQNLIFYTSQEAAEQSTHKEKLQLSATILGNVAEAFYAGLPAPTLNDLQKRTGAPFTLVSHLLSQLTAVRLIVPYRESEDSPTTFLPAQDTDTLTLALLVRRLEEKEEDATTVCEYIPLGVVQAFEVSRKAYLEALEGVLVREIVGDVKK